MPIGSVSKLQSFTEAVSRAAAPWASSCPVCATELTRLDATNGSLLTCNREADCLYHLSSTLHHYGLRDILHLHPLDVVKRKIRPCTQHWSRRLVAEIVFWRIRRVCCVERQHPIRWYVRLFSLSIITFRHSTRSAFRPGVSF